MHAKIPASPPRTSLFEDLIHYTLTLPQSSIPSLLSQPNTLGLPILSLIAAEWLTVIGYITTGLTKIEWELEHPTYRDSSFGLDGALDRLHPLRRLIPVYRTMILEILSTILAPSNLPPESPGAQRSKLAILRSDFNSLLASIDRLQIRTQNIISLATTIISIEENKRAMKMNTNLVRVTYLAVVFVPMAFVSSFFSMTPNLGDLEQTFWIYFAIAVPLTGVCLVVADQGRGVKAGWRWVGRNVWKNKLE
jgi:Mg2+ and Co2+ transporter CorA